MTQDDVLRLVGRLAVDNEAARIHILQLEAEVARRQPKPKSNVVKMQPKAAEQPEVPAPADTKPPEEKGAADPVPNQ